MRKYIKPYLLTGVALLSLNGCFANNDTTTIVESRRQQVEETLNNYTLQNNNNIVINKSGTYVIKGSATDATIIVEADKKDNISIVLDSVTITNTDAPAIYVKSAKELIITTINKNTLSVSSDYKPDGETNLDAVIFSRSDLIFNGLGSLNINSAKGNGISSKDNLTIISGYFTIESLKDGLEANDSIQINGGDLAIKSQKDTLHSEGYIQINNGVLELYATDDAIRGTSYVLIDGGTINIPKSSEGIEATEIEINGGKITINSSDDGINATQKIPGDVKITVNGGDILINMADGDTDGFDSNGDLFINGGNIEVNARSAFDADGKAELKNVSVTVNGVKMDELPITRGGFRRR